MKVYKLTSAYPPIGVEGAVFCAGGHEARETAARLKVPWVDGARGEWVKKKGWADEIDLLETTDPGWYKELLEEIAGGSTVEEAAAAVGISPSTAYDHRRKNSALAALWDEAVENRPPAEEPDETEEREPLDEKPPDEEPTDEEE